MNSSLKKLFSLIHSLSTTEKQYFRERAAKGTPELLPLFTTLDATLIYKENNILVALQAHYPNGFASLIEQTLQAIIELLVDSRQNNFIKLRQLTKGIAVLYRKKKYHLCVALLDTAKEIAVQYEMWKELDAVLYWERILAGYIKSSRKAELILQDQVEVRRQLANLHRYNILKLKASEVEGSILVKGKARNIRLKQLLQDPLLQDESTAYCNEAKMIFHSIKANIYYDLESYTEAHYHYKKMLGIYRRNAMYIKLNFFGYLAIINNFASISIYLKHYADAMRMANELKHLEVEFDFVKSQNMHNELMVRAYYIELECYAVQLKLEKAAAMAPHIEKSLFRSKSPVKVLYKVGILYQIAEVFFVLGNFPKTLKYIAKLYECDHPQLGVDLQTKGRLLELLIYIELKLDKQFAEGMAFLKKYLKENKIHSRHITLFLDVTANLIQELSDEKRTLILKEYLALFTALKPSLSQQDAYFDIVPWLESKLYGLPLYQVLKNKYALTEVETALS